MAQIVLGHIALIQRSKKQDFSLKVLSKLKAMGHEVVGLFPGECREPEYLEELNELVKELNLQKDVLFLGRREDIPDLLKLMDVLIIPSFEGFPLAGLEAAAAGVPVVACEEAGAKEFVDFSKAGLTYPEGDVVNAGRAIMHIYDNTEYKKRGICFASGVSLKAYKSKVIECFGKVITHN